MTTRALDLAGDRPTAAPAIQAVTSIGSPWLFSAQSDVAMLALPMVVTACAYIAAMRLGEDALGSARGYAGWVTSYALGNTSHVLLTYLLLGTRRDMLHATPTQARSVITASAIVFALSLALMRLTHGNAWTSPFFETVTIIFASHHTLSQAKGLWALYGLRGAQEGLPPPTSRERELQKIFVPLALLLIAVKWTLVARADIPGAGPYKNVNPGDPAVLPYELMYVLIAAWLAFSGTLLYTLIQPGKRDHRVNVPKTLYLSVHCSVVLLQLISPSWGVSLSAGIHGLEYFFLTRRMLAPTSNESTSRLTAALCWPAMILSMSPILAVGVMLNPFLPFVSIPDSVRTWSVMLVNATVLAHYAADAFIYRFRIPEVRKVAMARLRFDAPVPTR